MGLFNFIYKLTNILSNKRKIKVFIVIAIIILLLFCWSRGVFASTAEDDLTLLNYQIVLQDGFIDYLQYLYTRKPTGFDQQAFNSIVYHMNWAQIYVEIPTSTANCNFEVYFYNPTANGNSVNMFNVTGTWSIGLNSGTQIDCMLGDVTMTYRGELKTANTGTTPIFYNNSSSKYMPAAMFCVRSNKINDFLKTMGYMSELNPTYATHDQQLQSVVSSGFTNEVNAINQVDETLNDVNASVEDVNQSVMEMIETIVDPYVNVSQQQLPTEEVNDTTQEPLNTLFDYIKNAFTGEPTGFSLPLPFVGGEVRIEPDMIQTAMRNARTWCFSYIDRGLLVVSYKLVYFYEIC